MSANEGITRILQSRRGGNQVNFILTRTKSFDLTLSQVINNKRSQTKKEKTFEGLKNCVQEGYSS